MSNPESEFKVICQYLENWTSLVGPEVYDFNRMGLLLGAILNNLEKYAQEHEIEELGVILTKNQRRQFLYIAKYLNDFKEENFPDYYD